MLHDQVDATVGKHARRFLVAAAVIVAAVIAVMVQSPTAEAQAGGTLIAPTSCRYTRTGNNATITWTTAQQRRRQPLRRSILTTRSRAPWTSPMYRRSSS